MECFIHKDLSAVTEIIDVTLKVRFGTSDSSEKSGMAAGIIHKVDGRNVQKKSKTQNDELCIV